MLKASVVVTALAHKSKFQKLISCLIVACLIIVVLYVPYLFVKSNANCPFLVSDKTCINLEVVNTDASRISGLSGRDNMLKTSGMLFIFDEVGRHCIWMKDMKFPLDIIWLNDYKKITHIENDVRPETYPKSFCPSSNTKYVIELNEGVAQEAKLYIGQRLSL